MVKRKGIYYEIKWINLTLFATIYFFYCDFAKLIFVADKYFFFASFMIQ